MSLSSLELFLVTQLRAHRKPILLTPQFLFLIYRPRSLPQTLRCETYIEARKCQSEKLETLPTAARSPNKLSAMFYFQQTLSSNTGNNLKREGCMVFVAHRMV